MSFQGKKGKDGNASFETKPLVVTLQRVCSLRFRGFGLRIEVPSFRSWDVGFGTLWGVSRALGLRVLGFKFMV